MNYYIKQHFLSLNSKFDILDEDGNQEYFVEGKFFKYPKEFSLYDSTGKEVIRIEQVFLSLLPKFRIFKDNKEVAVVKRDFTFFTPSYSVEYLNWEIKGEFWLHDYEIVHNRNLIARISKRILSWSDTYEINVRQPELAEIVLAIVIIIDENIAQDDSNTATNASM